MTAFEFYKDYMSKANKFIQVSKEELMIAFAQYHCEQMKQKIVEDSDGEPFAYLEDVQSVAYSYILDQIK